ncbi:MAG: hypothetical protein P4M09_05510 [Devosia sp.]|nr:hypothetical protein [Devosia sp.]
MADTYRGFLRGACRWQDIAVIDLRAIDGTGKRLQNAGLRTLGQIDMMTGPELLKLPGVGPALAKSVRATIKLYKNIERRRRHSVPVATR